MDRLLTEMSSTFNQSEETQINLTEDSTLKWRGLHNNSYASNKRRTRKSAKIEENSAEDRAIASPNGPETTMDNKNGSAVVDAVMRPPPTPADQVTGGGGGGGATVAVKTERVTRRTRTSGGGGGAEVTSGSGNNSSSTSSTTTSSAAVAVEAQKRTATHANGAVNNNKAQAQKPTTVSPVASPSSSSVGGGTVVGLSSKSNKDKDQQQSQAQSQSSSSSSAEKDNDEEVLLLQKLPLTTHTTATAEGTTTAAVQEGTNRGAETETESVVANGDGGSAARHSKRVTRQRPSTGGGGGGGGGVKEETVNQQSLKRRAEEELSEKRDPPVIVATNESVSGEEKKPRLLMKIRTDNKSVSIVQNTPSEGGGGGEEKTTLEDGKQQSNKSQVSTDPSIVIIAEDHPIEPSTDTAAVLVDQPKKRGRKPGSSLKNKFPEKLKILPKRTGVRGQQSPEQSQQTSPPVQSPQRPSRRIKPTPKILENEELRHGFEQQNSARLLGMNPTEYDGKKAALIRAGSGQVEQLSVDNIYTSSGKPCPEPEDFLHELKISKLNSSNGNSPPTDGQETDERLDRKQQKLKERHFHQLGLRKTSRSDTESEPSLEGGIAESDGPFRAPQQKANGRGMGMGPKPKRTHSHNNHLQSDDLQVRRKVQPNSVSVSSLREKFVCLCNQSAEFYSHNKSAKSLFCSAVDQIRGEKVGCCNDISASQLNLQRPSARVSFMVLCQGHENRFHAHHCCPVCGVFCTEGQFMLCPRNHLFHRDCVLRSVTAGGGGRERVGRNAQEMIKCPHCAVDCSNAPEINLYMECSNELTYYPNQEGFIKTARISLSNGGFLSLPDPANPYGGFNIDALIPESVQNVRDRYRHRRGGGVHRSGSEGGEFTSHEFFHAVNNDDIEKVAEIIASGFDVSAPFKEFHWGTCLHLIAHFGSLNMMYLILSRVSSLDFINAQDKELRTAAMCAVVGEKHEILRLLVQCGADVVKRGPDGMTVLHLAAKVGNFTATEIVLEHFRLKVTVQRFEAFLNAIDDGQWTALVWAAENGLSKIESYLISLGASPNICDSENNSALHWAALSNKVETILPLLGSSCDFNLQNVNGDTALHIACRHGNAHMCLIFIAHGADLQIRNLSEETPLDCVPDPHGNCAKLIKYNIQLKGISGTAKNNKIVLSNDISMGREAYPVKLIGHGDNLALPNFKYVTQAIIIQNNIQIDRRISQMRICACPDNCTTDACQCGEISSQNWYDGNGRLSNEFNFDDPPMIFECNDVCGCHKLLCKNRVVQNGSKVALQVERSAKKIKGWSAKCLSDIPKGAFVSEYTGEILTNAEADQRMDDSYFFDLGGSEHCIDANLYGNVSRFFNHSCSPNVVPIRVYFEHQDLRFPKIAFFASENIPANQEITFDYGDKFWMVKHKYFTCQCESPNCRYSAQTIAKTMEEMNQRSQPITIIT